MKPTSSEIQSYLIDQRVREKANMAPYEHNPFRRNIVSVQDVDADEHLAN